MYYFRILFLFFFMLPCIGGNAQDLDGPNSSTNCILLDELLRKFIENNDDKEYCEGIISGVYKGNGPYLGALRMEQEIFTQLFYTFFSRNTSVMRNNKIDNTMADFLDSEGNVFFKHYKGKTDELIELQDKFDAALVDYIDFYHKASFYELKDKLDDFFVKSKFADEKKKKVYDNLVKYYEIKFRNIQDPTQAAMLNIASRVYVMESICFDEYLVSKFDNNIRFSYKGDMQSMKSIYLDFMKKAVPDPF